jgi:hypothetical protein
MFNLNLETNEILLSSIVNPYRPACPSNDSSRIISTYLNGTEYKTRSVSTGDDYPHWWVRLTTDLILADFITDQGEEKEKSLLSPSPRQDQSVQTDIEKFRPSSSSRIQKSSSSSTTNNHYELIDDENNAKRPTSSKQFEADYNTFVSSLNQHQQSSTPESYNHRIRCHSSSNETTRSRKKSSESESTTVIASLLERYERTLRQRQRAFAIINDQLLDIDDVLQHYRDKMYDSTTERSNTVNKLSHYLLCIMVRKGEGGEREKKRKKHFTFSTLSGLYIIIHFFFIRESISSPFTVNQKKRLWLCIFFVLFFTYTESGDASLSTYSIVIDSIKRRSIIDNSY